MRRGFGTGKAREVLWVGLAVGLTATVMFWDRFLPSREEPKGHPVEVLCEEDGRDAGAVFWGRQIDMGHEAWGWAVARCTVECPRSRACESVQFLNEMEVER